MEKYLQILEESLIKKEGLLNEILACSKRQEKLLCEERLDFEQFDELVNKKDGYVDELVRLDEGFEKLYANVSTQLNKNRDLYKNEISRMQKSITGITEKSIQIQALEARNKSALEKCFMKERSNLRTGRQSSAAAYNYYRNMSYGNVSGASILDEKN